MADESIDIDLDPKKVLQSLKDIAKATEELATKVEESLGKDAVKSVEKLEETAEKGASKISEYFRNLGTRIKEDLKTAFDATKIMAGANLAKDLGAGVQQVFEMERAFDRLNTRLKLTSKQLQDFKKDVGSKVAATGQRLEDVLPGVETAAGKGGVKSQGQLAAIGEILAKSRSITGENTQTLSEDIIDIIHNQGQQVTAANFKKTMDAVQASRVGGAFNSAADAAAAIKEITHGLTPEQQKRMGIGAREAGGLAAVASQAEGGTTVLNKLLSTGQTAGGQQLINSIFGSQVFKNGKVSTEGLANINKQNLGKFSPQVMSEALGVDQAELARFIDSMKNNMAKFGEVTHGANETAAQFDMATDNFASKIDKFKEQAKEAGREVGESISSLAKDLLSGSFKKLGADAKNVGSTIWENKGAAAGALGTAALSAVLLGGGLNSILKKVPGVGGLVGGIAGGEAAKAAGVTPVYVVNASEIGGGAGILGGALSKGGGILSKALPFLGNAGMVGAAGAAGFGLGELINKATGNNGQIGEWLYNVLHQQGQPAGMAEQMHPDVIAKAVQQGTEAAHKNIPKEKVQYTNKSAVQGTGRKI